MEVIPSTNVKNTTERITAWVYVAVSSAPQEHGLEHDEAWARSFAAQQGWRVTRVYGDVASGKDGARDPIKRLLSDLRLLKETERPTYVLMTRLDRIGREAIDSQLVLRDIRRLGVKVWTRQRGEDKGDTAMEKMVSAIELYVAEHENDVKRDRIRAAYDRKRKAGVVVGNRAPYGLRIEGGKYVPDPVTGPAVAEAFRLRAEGMSETQLAHQMALTAPTHVWKNGRPWILNWDVWTVQQMVRRHAYVEAGIIDEDTFRSAQVDLARWHGWRERHRTRFPWPLSGVIQCACGKPLRGQPSGPDPYRVRYYICYETAKHPPAPPSNRRKVAGGPWIIRHNADRIEASFLRALLALRGSRMTPDLAATILAQDARHAMDERVEIGGQIKEVEREISELEGRIEAAWHIGEVGRIDPAEVRARLDTLRGQQATLRSKVAELQALQAKATPNLRKATDASALLKRTRLWSHASVDVQKDFAKRVAALLGPIVVGYDGSLSLTGHLVSRLLADAQGASARAVAPRGMLLSVVPSDRKEP